MIVAYVASSVFLLLACGCAQGIFHWLRQSYVTSRWPTVPGKITSSWEVLDGERVKYDYAVDGKHYVGHRVSWGRGAAPPSRPTRNLPRIIPPDGTSRSTTTRNDRRPRCSSRATRNLTTSIVFTLAFGFFGAVFLTLALTRGG